MSGYKPDRDLKTYSTASNNTTPILHVGNRGRELLASNVVKVNINAFGGDASKGFNRLFSLVVKASIETKLVNDVVELLLGSNRATE